MSFSSSPKRRQRALGLAALMVLLGLAGGAWHFSAGRRTIDLNSQDPFWTASIQGTPGDQAQLWIWTPGPMRLTEVPVPSVIRLSRSDLLLQTRSVGLHSMRLEVRRGRGSVAVALATEEGSSNSLVFVSSVNRIPIPGYQDFSAHPFNPSVPMGLRPLYSPPWHTHHTGFDLVEPLPAPTP